MSSSVCTNDTLEIHFIYNQYLSIFFCYTNQKINDNWGGSMELLEDKVEYKIYHCQKKIFQVRV